MKYKEFLIQLAIEINVNIKTLHSVFSDQKAVFDITKFMNNQTIRAIKSGFNKHLLDNAIDKFDVSYDKVSNAIHPTKFTDRNGGCLAEIPASDVGTMFVDGLTAQNYFFDEIYFDSELERKNILQNIEEVIVFTKIPKKSIKIPVAGGFTYSPDFAYIIKDNAGNKSLSLIVETKNKAKRDLYIDEKQKIKHAEKLFSNSDVGFSVKFKTQFDNDAITDILKNVCRKTA